MRTGSHEAANWNWSVLASDKTVARSAEHALLAVLMDIREELRGLTERLDCHEFVAIPRTLRRVAANTARPKKQKKPAR
jgi:hypothetical protein